MRPEVYGHLQHDLKSITIPEETPRDFGFELATDSASCSLTGSFAWRGKAERGSGSASHVSQHSSARCNQSRHIWIKENMTINV